MSKRPRSLSDGASSAPITFLASAASAPSAAPLLSPFAEQLRAAGISSDNAALNCLAALGANKGVMDMEDLHGLNEADVRASVAHMLLSPMQLNKLLKRLATGASLTPLRAGSVFVFLYTFCIVMKDGGIGVDDIMQNRTL